MGFRRRHRSHSRDASPEHSTSRPQVEGDATSSSGSHRPSSSRRHHRGQHHSERPRRRRERPEWLKLILRAQRQFVGAILMSVGLCLSWGAQLVSSVLLGSRAQPIEDRPQESPSGGGDRTPIAANSPTTVSTRSYAFERDSGMDDLPIPNQRAIVAPEDLD